MLPTWITGAIASRLVLPIAGGLALLSAIGCTVQTVRLDGVHLFGWTMMSGSLDREAKLQATIDDPKTGWRVRLGRVTTNFGTCSAALDRQNSAVAGLQKARAARQAAANQAVAEAAAANRALDSLAAAIKGMKPPAGADLCAAADGLILKGVPR